MKMTEKTKKQIAASMLETNRTGNYQNQTTIIGYDPETTEYIEYEGVARAVEDLYGKNLTKEEKALYYNRIRNSYRGKTNKTVQGYVWYKEEDFWIEVLGPEYEIFTLKKQIAILEDRIAELNKKANRVD